MKKILLFSLVLIALTLFSCVKEPAPEYRVGPSVVIIESGLPISSVPSGQPYQVFSNIINKYGVCYVQIDYRVEWTETDEDGTKKEHTEEMTTGRRTFRESTEPLYFEAYIPGQDANAKNADMKVTWSVSAENQYGLKAASENRTYTVFNQNAEER